MIKNRFKHIQDYILILIVFAVFSFSNAFAGIASLSWDPPTTNEDGTPLADLSGYKIYYGTASFNYTQNINVGNVTTYTVSNLTDGLTYYFAVTAYDSSLNESDYSSELSKTIPSSQQHTLTVTKAGTGTGSVTSAPGGISCGLDCSENYNYNTQVTLAATPATGSTFGGWSGDADCSDGVVTMTAGRTCTATFNQQIFSIDLNNPLNEEIFNMSSYYFPPTFQWNTNGAFKSLEIQFSKDNFSTISKKVKVEPTINEVVINRSTWKTVLVLPGKQGGTVYWRIEGATANITKVRSNVFSFTVEEPRAVGTQQISMTSKTLPPPSLTWQNNYNVKFKAWFGSDPDFTKPGIKKKALTFTIKNPLDNEGSYTKTLTKGQWTAIRKVVGDISGMPIYWYIESWDALKRYTKSDVISFTLTD